MTITFPLALPTHIPPKAVTVLHKPLNAVSISPFTGSQQVQEGNGAWFEFDVILPPMIASNAALWNAFFLKLNGMVGTFLMGDPSYVKRGNCTAADVSGAVTARNKELPIKNATIGTTIKAGDYIQLGSGLDTRLHKNLNDIVVDGSGTAILDIWPSTRKAYSDGDTITLVDPKGLFRLSANEISYTVGEGVIYTNIAFGAREAI